MSYEIDMGDYAETYCKLCQEKISSGEPKYYHTETGFGPVCGSCIPGETETKPCPECGYSMMKDMLGSDNWYCWKCEYKTPEIKVRKNVND